MAAWVRMRPILQDRALRAATLDQLRERAQTDPHNERLFYYLGLREQEAGRLAEARAAFQQAAANGVDDEEAWMAWAASSAALGDTANAFGTLSAYEKAHPSSAAAHKALARLYAGQGAYALACREAQTAVDLAPRDADAWDLLSARERSLLHLPKAEADSRQAVALAPNDWRYVLALGQVLAAQGRDADALEEYRTAARLAPDQPSTVLALGGALLGRPGDATDRAAALKTLQQAVRLNPRSAMAWNWLGRAYADDGRSADAVAALKRSTQMDPLNAETHYRLQLAYQRIGDAAHAAEEAKIHRDLQSLNEQKRKLFDRMQAAPNDVDARLQFARLCASHGDYLDAVIEYRHLIVLMPNSDAVRREFADAEGHLPKDATP